MKIVATVLTLAFAAFIAAPAHADEYPAMVGHPIGPVMQGNRQAYPVQRSYQRPIYDPRIERRPVFERRAIGYPAYGGGGGSVVGGFGDGYGGGNVGGYESGGSQFQTFHYHHEEFHERQVHVEARHEVIREAAPTPVVHVHHRAPCYARHVHVRPRPVIVRQPCCCCCNTCGVAVAADPRQDTPSDPPNVTDDDRTLSSADVEFLKSVYK